MSGDVMCYVSRLGQNSLVALVIVWPRQFRLTARVERAFVVCLSIMVCTVTSLSII